MFNFDITEEGNHKVFNFWGIKIKFKSRLGYDIKGSNNKIIIIKDGLEQELKNNQRIDGLDIKIAGNNNYVKIDCNNFQNSSIHINSSNSKVIIDNTDRLYCLCISICCGNNQILKWGEGSNTWGTSIFLHEENAVCVVGKNCMFSGGINIWTTDGHAIIDSDSGKVLNLNKYGVKIGDNCWIGQYVHFTKNAIINDGTIVGARAVVTKEFKDKNIIIAGNPAKVVRKNVSWRRKTAYICNEQLI